MRELASLGWLCPPLKSRGSTWKGWEVCSRATAKALPQVDAAQVFAEAWKGGALLLQPQPSGRECHGHVLLGEQQFTTSRDGVVSARADIRRASHPRRALFRRTTVTDICHLSECSRGPGSGRLGDRCRV